MMQVAGSWLSDVPHSLQPQGLAITTLGAYGRVSGEPVWSGGMVRLLGEFGFSVGAARVALGRLVRSGLLERVRRGRQIYYGMSPALEHLLAEGDERIFGLGVDDDWTGVWTVLWQAVPDELGPQRRRLAGRLRFLGFGPVQNGTWVSPHDRARELTALVDDLAIEQYVGVIVGRPATGNALQTLIGQAWDLDVLADGYERFLGELRPFRSARSRGRLSDRDAFLVRTRAVHEFRQFPSQDPGLPEVVLNRRWRRSDAVAAFRELYELLAEPAQRHFDHAMEGGRAAALPLRRAAARL